METLKRANLSIRKCLWPKKGLSFQPWKVINIFRRLWTYHTKCHSKPLVALTHRISVIRCYTKLRLLYKDSRYILAGGNISKHNFLSKESLPNPIFANSWRFPIFMLTQSLLLRITLMLWWDWMRCYALTTLTAKSDWRAYFLFWREKYDLSNSLYGFLRLYVWRCHFSSQKVFKVHDFHSLKSYQWQCFLLTYKCLGILCTI